MQRSNRALSIAAALLLVAGAAPADRGALTAAEISAWLAGYREAWETRDPRQAAALFTEDATYQDNPFNEPYRGRAGIASYWATVTADQRDVSFDSQLLGIDGRTAFVHWRAEFVNASNGAAITLDGVFVLDFDHRGLCERLREWWHIVVAGVER